MCVFCRLAFPQVLAKYTILSAEIIGEVSCLSYYVSIELIIICIKCTDAYLP